MNIVISNYDSIGNPFYAGGGAQAMHELGKRLAVRHNVTIVCGAYRNCKEYVRDGVRYAFIGPQAGPIWGQLMFSLMLPFAAMRRQYDVWLENFVPPHSTNFIQLVTRKPVIGITSIINASKFSQKYHIPFYLLENTGLRMYRYFIALTDDIKKKILEKNSGAVVQVFPDGIDERLLTLSTKELPYVFYLGRIDMYQKGLDLLLQAWKRVSEEHPKIKLVIAGSGTDTDEARLRSRIRTLDITQSVMLQGKISGKKKDTLIANSLFAVSPSRFESFGIAALEMLAVGKPLVCFDIEGFRWIPRSMCYKVQQFDTDAFAKAMHVLIKNKKIRSAFSGRARKFASRYNWDKIALQYEEFITDVVGRKV